MAEQGQKTMSFAYSEISLQEFKLLQEVYGFESDEFREQLEVDLIYVCTFGQTDPMRAGLQKSIQTIKKDDNNAKEAMEILK